MTTSIDWIEQTDRGWYIRPGGFYVDPHEPAKRAVISHAHADHYPPAAGEVWASSPTLALISARSRKGWCKAQHGLTWGESIDISGVRVTLQPAGHILGSAQIALQYNGQTVLYSGDIGLAENPTCEAIHFPETRPDVLICEATFSRKPAHPDPVQEVTRIFADMPKPILMGVYPVGKAQRLTDLLTTHFPEVRIFCHPMIWNIHRVYSQFGFSPGNAQLYRRQLTRETGVKYVLMVPPRMMSGYARETKFTRLFATGWQNAEQRAYLDGNFELSDHASAEQLIQYVGRVNPRETWFWHGDAGPLIRSCEEMGISAKAVPG